MQNRLFNDHRCKSLESSETSVSRQRPRVCPRGRRHVREKIVALNRQVERCKCSVRLFAVTRCCRQKLLSWPTLNRSTGWLMGAGGVVLNHTTVTPWSVCTDTHQWLGWRQCCPVQQTRRHADDWPHTTCDVALQVGHFYTTLVHIQGGPNDAHFHWRKVNI